MKVNSGEYDPYASDLYSVGITILKTVEPSIRANTIFTYFLDDFKKEYKKAFITI